MFAQAQQQARQNGLRVPTNLSDVRCCGEHRGFLEIWLELQTRSGRLDAGFPRCWHWRLVQSWPRLAATKDLVETYRRNNGKRLSASCMAKFAKTVLDGAGPGDAEEHTLRRLLELVPDLGELTEVEVTQSRNKEERRHQTSTQVLVAAAQPGPLQRTVDAHQRLERVDNYLRQILVTKTGPTVFLLLNNPCAELELGPCVLTGRVYQPVGVLLLRSGHYTALVQAAQGWTWCDDLRPQCQLVRDPRAVFDPRSVRLVVLRAQDAAPLDPARALAGFTNAGNTCHVSAVLQLLLQTTEFVGCLPE